MRHYARMVRNFMTNKIIRFGYLTELGIYNKMPDEKFIKMKFKIFMGENLNLDNPQLFNEKLQWLKIYNRKPEYTMMVDKYLVRQYIADIIGDKYLIPLLGVWNEPDEIDFEKMPNQFVLKCNHNSGRGMCICKNKSELNISKVKHELREGLKENYYLKSREWPYKNVPRKIIAEKYMIDDTDKQLKDYKFYCFNGVVKFLMINSDRNSPQNTKADYFDRNFNWLDFTWGYEHAKVRPQRPSKFNEMIVIAEKLAQNIPHVRVDLYECNGNIYFGELTFYDGGGFDKIEPIEWDYKIGSMLEI